MENNMKCRICDSDETIRSFASHLRWKHPELKTEDYVKIYGEFRPKQIKKIIEQNQSDIKCEICNKKLISHKNLIHHLNIHINEISWEEYFIKYFFNGTYPLCKCGCKGKTQLIRHGKNDKGEISYSREYIKGHWDWIKPGYHYHSEKTKTQMRKSSIKRIENEKGLYKGVSKLEIELQDFIKTLTPNDILLNDTTLLSGHEIDIYIPLLNLAIEFNGTYYHSDLFKKRMYHLNKTKECNKLGVRLIYIWDSDWIYRNEIIKSQLKNIFNKTSNKIFARKCIIRLVDKKNGSYFLEKNHLQGSALSKYNIGLFYQDELVSLMTFGKLRKNLKQNHIDGEYELIRFCNKLDTQVIGGASKLFSFFIKNYHPNRIISYANRDWSNGNLYSKINMVQLTPTPPGYNWYKSKIKYNRFNFRKDKLVKEGYDPNSTEYEIMTKRGFYRVWNSGNLKFEWLY